MAQSAAKRNELPLTDIAVHGESFYPSSSSSVYRYEALIYTVRLTDTRRSSTFTEIWAQFNPLCTWNITQQTEWSSMTLSTLLFIITTWKAHHRHACQSSVACDISDRLRSSLELLWTVSNRLFFGWLLLCCPPTLPYRQMYITTYGRMGFLPATQPTYCLNTDRSFNVNDSMSMTILISAIKQNFMLSRQRLRSSSSDRLHVPIIRRSTVGSHTFTAFGAAVWNDLLAHVTAAPSLAVFSCALRH